MNKKIETIKIYGKTIRTSNKKPEEIGLLWQDVLATYHHQELFAIYHDYESNENGMFSLTVGGRNEMDGFAVFEIPMGTYIEIPTKTNDIEGVKKSWQDIWENKKLPRAFEIDFEWYKENGGIDIYLSKK